MIPKIIHQIMPSDKSRWHPVWKICHPTWEKHYPDFEHKKWDDVYIDSFVKEEFPEYFQIYDSFTTHILRIDFARMAILYKHGGIYADMDMYCYRNFYDELTGSVNLVQSNGIKNVDCNEHVQNSLMAVEANHSFVKDCMDEICDRFLERQNSVVYAYENKNIISALSHYYSELILQISGPVMLSEVYEKYSDVVNVLPRELYNDGTTNYREDYRTKHMMTGLWGKEYLASEDELKTIYKEFRCIDLDQFDFYKKYN